MALRPRTWKPFIPLAYHYNTGRTSGICTHTVRTYAPGKYLNSDLKPPETSIFLCFSYDFPPIFTPNYFDFLYIHFSIADVYLLRSDTFNTKPSNQTTSFTVTFSSLALFLLRTTYIHTLREWRQRNGRRELRGGKTELT
jgi:hypothetical protein